MIQQLKTDKTETRDPELTTADIARSNPPVSRAQGLGLSSAETTSPRPNRNQLFSNDHGSVAHQHDEAVGSASSDLTNADFDGSPSNDEDQVIAPLFAAQESQDFHVRWDAVQVSFVDEPRRAVQQADGLVAGAMQRLAEIFADERAKLDRQWDRGDSVSTEELRIALRRYRSFFGRLLSV